MHPDVHEWSRRLEERLSRVQVWLRARRHAHDPLARARADLADMARDGGPPSPVALRGEELDALTHHLQLTASLLPRFSNLDDPGWRAAHEEYERSWDEVHHAFEAGDTAAR